MAFMKKGIKNLKLICVQKAQLEFDVDTEWKAHADCAHSLPKRGFL
jgi:hypothetical protein